MTLLFLYKIYDVQDTNIDIHTAVLHMFYEDKLYDKPYVTSVFKRTSVPIQRRWLVKSCCA